MRRRFKEPSLTIVVKSRLRITAGYRIDFDRILAAAEKAKTARLMPGG
jgi:hypothetical protein